MIGFPAKLEKQHDGTYFVFFLGPDMEDCHCYGSSLEEAKRNAKSALDHHITYLLHLNMEIPHPIKVTGKDICYIYTEDNFDNVYRI